MTSKVLEDGLQRHRARLRELNDEHERLFAQGVTGHLRTVNERRRRETAEHIALLEAELATETAPQAPSAPAAPATVVVRLTGADKQGAQRVQRSAASTDARLRPSLRAGWVRCGIQGIANGHPVDVPPSRVAEFERLDAARGLQLSGPKFRALKAFMEGLAQP
jgi:hypothetical protein